MEQNESNLSFDQLPKAVGELLTKVDYVISRLDEKKEADGSSPTLDDDQMMTMDEACQFIGKKRSTMYSLTSERRIPYRKRGNKLYFFKKELVEWILVMVVCSMRVRRMKVLKHFIRLMS